MRSKGTAVELEKRRRLAVQRAQQGWRPKDIADFLGVTPRTLSRWLAAHRAGGAGGLAARPTPGRPPKLSAAQEAEVLSWLARKATDFGFPSDLWTAPRLAGLIASRLGVRFHPRYLNAWLAERRFSPQKPEGRAREQDEVEVERWTSEDWPRLQKKAPTGTPTSC